MQLGAVGEVVEVTAQTPRICYHCLSKEQLGLVISPDRSSRYNQDFQWKLFGPRLGLAYRITDQTVARLGYGIFFLPNDISFNSGTYGSPVNNTTTLGSPPLITNSLRRRQQSVRERDLAARIV